MDIWYVLIFDIIVQHRGFAPRGRNGPSSLVEKDHDDHVCPLTLTGVLPETFSGTLGKKTTRALKPGYKGSRRIVIENATAMDTKHVNLVGVGCGYLPTLWAKTWHLRAANTVGWHHLDKYTSRGMSSNYV
jgi:hypothetical protein